MSASSAPSDHSHPLASPSRKRPPGRARQSCNACRLSKAKCDALTTFPCRRCQLHGIECVLEGVNAAVPSFADAGGNKDKGDNTKVERNTMRVVLSRLDGIQQALARIGRHGLAEKGLTSPSSPLNGHAFGLAPDGPFAQVDLVTRAYNGVPEGKPFGSSPDAVQRAIITYEEAIELFKLYWERLDPTDQLCLSRTDHDAVNVRARSPLLLNSVFVVAAYYAFLHNDRNRKAYAALVMLQSELLGRTLQECRRGTPCMARETIDALLLVVSRKTLLQSDASGARPITLADQFAFKLDSSNAQVLLGAAHRIARLLNLQKRSIELLTSQEECSEEDLLVIRTWLSVRVVDGFSECQAGHLPSSSEIEDEALLNGLLVLNMSPADLECGALVALFQHGQAARRYLFAALGRSDGVTEHERDVAQLHRFRAEIAAWREVWLPRLEMKSTVYLVSRFYRVLFVSRFVNMWLGELREVQGTMTMAQMDLLSGAIVDAQEAIFSLSCESRAPHTLEGRQMSWSSSAGGDAPEDTSFAPLAADPEQVQLVSGTIDAINCVVLPFLALFLASTLYRNIDADRGLSAESLLPISQPVYMNPQGRLARLLELTIDVFEKAAPHPTHPCIGHAYMLRSLLARGTSTESTPVSGGAPEWEATVPSFEGGVPGPDLRNQTAATLQAYLDPMFTMPEAQGDQMETFDYHALLGAPQDVIDWEGLLSS